MPTIEFFGYLEEHRQGLEALVRKRLAPETFHEECVFVAAGRSYVRDWHGNDRPFVRVSTRSAQRAERLKSALGDLSDIEVVRIDFQPMTGETTGDQA